MVIERKVATPTRCRPLKGEGKRQIIYAMFPWDTILATNYIYEPFKSPLSYGRPDHRLEACATVAPTFPENYQLFSSPPLGGEGRVRGGYGTAP